MTFRVGQKVVCVDASVVTGHPPGSELREGHIYTIRATGVTAGDEPGVRLQEVILTSGSGYVGAITGKPFKDSFYRASRFRPIVERKTDISIFTKMLTPEGVGA